MRYRKLSSSGDYVFGAGDLNYGVNTPDVVGQAVITRLRLLEGEWFMDSSAGTPWQTKVLGAHTGSTRDMVIFASVIGTPGVKKISNFSSRLNPETRQYSVTMTVDTIYGTTTLDAEVA